MKKFLLDWLYYSYMITVGIIGSSAIVVILALFLFVWSDISGFAAMVILLILALGAFFAWEDSDA